VIGLRPHQERAIAEVRAHYARGTRRVLLVAPTAYGKTHVAAHLIARAVERGRRVLFLVHLREVVLATARRLTDLGVLTGVVMSGVPASPLAPVQVASVATLAERRQHPPADLVVWDEAHHTAAESYRAIAAAYPGAWHLGLTATPERTDGVGLRDAFDALVVGAQISELVALGFLAPIEVLAPDTRGSSIAADPVEALGRFAPGRPALVYCRTVQESRECSEALNARGIAAAHIDGSTPAAQRDSALEAFARGDLQVICNVAVLTEGWDCPRAEVCVLARPTSSVAVFLQAVGRVRRAVPGKRALLLDLGGSVHDCGHPDQDREFTLDGIDRTPRADRLQLRRCAACGLVVERARSGSVCERCNTPWPAPRGVEVRAREIREVFADVQREPLTAAQRKFLRRLALIAEDRGYKPGWVAHRYRAQFGVWPPRDWRAT
jgi:superfamily II DNA or RNA helicase